MEVEIGRIRLKNPLIAGSAEHLIEAEGVRAALRAGVGAVVVKSTNRSQAARDQLQRAEYMVLDADWRPAAWGPQAPAHACIACPSGLTPQPVRATLSMLRTPADGYAGQSSTIIAGSDCEQRSNDLLMRIRPKTRSAVEKRL
jgi:hypothetical protein